MHSDDFISQLIQITQIGILEKRVHLFADDVGVAADGAGEEFSWFEDGETDFAEVECGEDFAGGLFDLVPERGFGRKEIARAFDGLELGFIRHFREEEKTSLDLNRQFYTSAAVLQKAVRDERMSIRDDGSG